jgi:hypothetical protein
VCGFPWITPFSPGESNQKYRKAAGEKNEANVVEARQLLPFRPVLVQKFKRWWVIEDEKQDNRKSCDYDV